MPEVAEVVEQVKEFDPVSYLKQANEADAARMAGKPAPEAPKESPKESPKGEEKPKESPKEPAKEAKHEESDDHEQPRLPRSARREMNRLREEAAELRGRLKAIEELGLSPKKEAEAKAEVDPEPVRSDFASDAEFQRAVGRWDARQEVKTVESQRAKTTEQEAQAKSFNEHCIAMEAKALEDMKTLKDWNQVAEAASGDDAPEFSPAEHPTLMGLIASSDAKAYVLYHFAKVPDDLQKMLDLTPNPGQQIRQFARLEERAEKMYSTSSSTAAAQAVDESSKDRTHPAEANAGRNTSERDARKPRPSSEVAARGGSAVPDEPAVGSKAWMERENQKYSSKTMY